MQSVRRWSAAAVAATLCGWLSTFAPAVAEDGRRAGFVGTAVVAAPEKAMPDVPAARPVTRTDCAKAKCVALTFDDGPMSSTAELLDVLAAHQARATFFLVGRNVAARPDLVRRELAAGHELGNHSYTHADLGRSSAAKVREELERTQEAIEQAAGVTPTLMRPPYGSTDKNLALTAKRMGMAQILWSVDPLDWNARDRATVERRIVKGVRPGRILLMHDIHASTVAAVPAILRRLAAQGYVFVTVSELFGGSLTPGKKYVQR
ncbi:polysaccharide deacetylase family protein [Actinomadura hibisca]|uniref:polysaccharide deacetylase family protein n=1 Tax=Actinomadura hibisca TaxID=68565 RepID=UPI001FE1F0E7|nr:polysaccharide deacetylase family protein [Actinomadura hibisca]